MVRLTLVLFLCTPILAAAGDAWPAWRGPTGDGVCDETTLPTTWGGPKQTNIRWKSPLFPSDKVRRDQNQSSPIVVGARVFVTLSYWPEGTTEKEYPEHHVLCFDARDGKKLWDTPVPPGPWKLTDLRGGYTAPTPCSDGKHLAVVFGSSVIAGLDLDGKIVWRQEIKPHAFDVAIGTSPILWKDTVIFAADQTKSTKASALWCFELATGKLRWKRDRSIDWTHSTPVIAKVAGKSQLVAAAPDGCQGFDPDSGEPIWSFAGARVGDTVTPLVHDGIVYLDSGRGGPGIAIDATGTGDVSKTHRKWSVKNVPQGFSSPVTFGDQIFRLHGSDQISSWKWSDGAEVYRERVEGTDSAVSPFVTPDGLIWCVTGGKSVIVKAGAKPEVVARNDLGDPGRASPAVAKGCIYVKGGRWLFCIGRPAE